MYNIAQRLVNFAQKSADTIAVVEPLPKSGPTEKRKYKTFTYAQLNRDSDLIAEALIRSGVQPEMRIALMVQYGIDFISLVFALLKSGATLVLIDPGMGVKQMLQCLDEAKLDGFAAISKVQAARVMLQNLAFPRRFTQAKHNLTVGSRWFWGGPSLEQIRKKNEIPTESILVPRNPDDPAAIIFTSGSTGIAKGVLFTHGIFRTQVEEIQKFFNIQPGGTDLAAFPFFGLFNAAMGGTAIIPDMDSTRPASVDPENILEAVRDWNIGQSFGSPALWNRVVSHCEKTGKRLDPLNRVVIAGAPVAAKLLERLKNVLPENSEIYTPYGATESLPVAVIGASEVLGTHIGTHDTPGTVRQTEQGKGICVGHRFGTIEWKVIGITDDPIANLEDATVCEIGEIGELAVTGPQVTKEYVTRTEANALAKMCDASGRIWHRIGDVGYLDAEDRFWFCGRKSHRVQTDFRTLFTIPCESIFNRHPSVYRSALVGAHGEPVVFIELEGDATKYDHYQLRQELRKLAQENPLTQRIEIFLFQDAFPVDVRHNAKINREKLAVIAGETINPDICKIGLELEIKERGQ